MEAQELKIDIVRIAQLNYQTKNKSINNNRNLSKNSKIFHKKFKKSYHLLKISRHLLKINHLPQILKLNQAYCLNLALKARDTSI